MERPNPAERNGAGELIDVAEAARRLGISEWSYRAHARAGRLPHIRLGRRILVPVAELNRFVGR